MAKVTVLKADVQHHAGEEEEESFPKVQKLLDEDELMALGAEVVKQSETVVI